VAQVDPADLAYVVETMAAAGVLRREPTAFEAQAGTDFARVAEQHADALTALLDEWQQISRDQRAALVEAIAAAVDDEATDRLSALAVDSTAAAALLAEHLTVVAELAAEDATAEAERQGVDLGDVPPAAPEVDHLGEVATATAALLAAGLATYAGQVALNVLGDAGPGAPNAPGRPDDAQGRSPGEQLAAQVAARLDELGTGTLERQLGGALSTAQHAGRVAVLRVAPPARYVASEILDSNVCSPCRRIDRHEFTSLDDALTAYPSGRYRLCQGQERCRGMIVAVWGSDVARTASAVDGGTMPVLAVDAPEDEPMPETAPGPAGTDTAGGKPTPGTKKDKRLKPNKYDADPGSPVVAQPSDDAWEGPLAIEGVRTGDKRRFQGGALSWPDPAQVVLPLRWNIEDSHGGEPRTVAVNVGRIDSIWRDESTGLIMGRGVFDLGHEHGREAHRRVGEGFLSGVSVDLDDFEVEYVMPEGDGADSEDDLFEILFAEPEEMLFTRGRIRGATLCDIPAFTEAYLKLVDRPAEEVDRPAPALVAHAAPIDEHRPPADWFADPKFNVPVPITVTDDGRVYGHAAQWGTCHVGIAGECVQPPREDSYDYYLTGEVLCAGGERMPVGQITVATGHAPIHGISHRAAAAHYDDTGSVVADVAVGTDSIGIWVAGAIRPGAKASQVYALRASGRVSGDWRRIGGAMRLVGLLGVNVAGFPLDAPAGTAARVQPRAYVAAGQTQALVAAGQLPFAQPVADVDPDVVHRAKADEIAARIGRPRKIESVAETA